MKELIEKNRKFFNRITRLYEFDLFRKMNNKIQKKVIASVRLGINSKVLDAGCGSAELLDLLYKKRKDLKLYGIDVSEKMLELARKRLKENARLSLQPVEENNFKDNYFNYIFSVDAFHHYAYQELAMDNFYRILKENGELIVVDFNFGKVGNWIFQNIEPGNSGMHSAQEFREIFEHHGFRAVKQKRGMFYLLTRGKKIKSDL